MDWIYQDMLVGGAERGKRREKLRLAKYAKQFGERGLGEGQR